MRALVLVLLLGCNPQAERTVRWPDHRKQHDDQLENLNTEVAKLRESYTVEIDALKRRIAKLEAEAVKPPPSP